MRSWGALLTATALALGATACGGDDDEDDEARTAVTREASDADDEPEEPEDDDEPEDADADAGADDDEPEAAPIEVDEATEAAVLEVLELRGAIDPAVDAYLAYIETPDAEWEITGDRLRDLSTILDDFEVLLDVEADGALGDAVEEVLQRAEVAELHTEQMTEFEIADDPDALAEETDELFEELDVLDDAVDELEDLVFG